MAGKRVYQAIGIVADRIGDNVVDCPDHVSPLEYDDGGQAIICHMESIDPEFFVRLHSWHDGAGKDDASKHLLMRRLIGKRIVVTIEVEDE